MGTQSCIDLLTSDIDIWTNWLHGESQTALCSIYWCQPWWGSPPVDSPEPTWLHLPLGHLLTMATKKETFKTKFPLHMFIRRIRSSRVKKLKLTISHFICLKNFIKIQNFNDYILWEGPFAAIPWGSTQLPPLFFYNLHVTMQCGTVQRTHNFCGIAISFTRNSVYYNVCDAWILL